MIIGQRTPNGALMMVDIEANIMRRIDAQPPVKGFVWH
jgi:hypothetical protein